MIPSFGKSSLDSASACFQLGMTRDEVLRTIREKNLKSESDELRPSTALYLLDMDTDLYFSPDAPFTLELIEVHDARARFGTLRTIGDFPHNIFGSIAEGNTLWSTIFLS